MLKFSNPRGLAEFNDWPSGALRVKCRFEIENGGKKGYRVARTTTDKNGRWCKPKKSTYGGPTAIVDGDDGRTYILVLMMYGGIKIMAHDFLDAVIPGRPNGGACVWESSEPELYAELLGIIKDTKAM